MRGPYGLSGGRLGDLVLEVIGFLFLFDEELHPYGFFAQG
jgi:hypothetical protein